MIKLFINILIQHLAFYCANLYYCGGGGYQYILGLEGRFWELK